MHCTIHNGLNRKCMHAFSAIKFTRLVCVEWFLYSNFNPIQSSNITVQRIRSISGGLKSVGQFLQFRFAIKWYPRYIELKINFSEVPINTRNVIERLTPQHIIWSRYEPPASIRIVIANRTVCSIMPPLEQAAWR